MRAGHSGLQVWGMTAVVVAGLGWGSLSSAESRCEKVQPVRGCVTSFRDIAKEQKKVDAFDKSINLRKSVEGVFKDVNGEDLVMKYLLSKYELRIDFNAKDVVVTLNGEKEDDLKLCYEACPNETTKVVWYTEKHGEFKKIKDGLSVGGYEFKIDEHKPQ